MSWKAEVQTIGDQSWNTNALRFATKEEAEAEGDRLARNWLLVTRTRATECDDPVNYQMVDGKARPINQSTPAPHQADA